MRSGAHRRSSRRLPADVAYRQLLLASFPFFMSQLLDPAGHPLEVALHHAEWCAYMAESSRLALLAPRSHGKTTVALCYILWRIWCHGRDRATGLRVDPAPGRYTVVVFSATHEQALVLLSTLRDLVLANPALFGDLRGSSGRDPGDLTRWSQRHVRFTNGAEVSTRAFGTSTRGLHPDLLVLDDVLNDENSLGQRQRDLTWDYFAGTLLPMSPGQLILVGSAVHQDDLFHRLAPRSVPPDPSRPDLPSETLMHGFEWIRYQALDEAAGVALWEARRPYAELVAFRAADPTIFSREYQNDPRDDTASLFSYEDTNRALDAGRQLTFVPEYVKGAREMVVLGADFALSDAATADFTVFLVVVYNDVTKTRRVLAAERRKGLTLPEQLTLLVTLIRRYDVGLAMVERNGFQRWLLDALRDWPDIRGRVMGHTTGREKADPTEGVPSLQVQLARDTWIMPCGDEASQRFARTWQAEMAAEGWTDGRIVSVSEHDDTVMAMWFVELAIRCVLDAPGGTAYLTMADLGLKRYRIGAPYDEDSHVDGGWDDADDGVKISPDY